MKEVVYNYPTKNKNGFTNSEMDELLKDYPNINMSKFNNALRGITHMMVDGEIIIYHCGILTALLCGVGGRDMCSYEID